MQLRPDQLPKHLSGQLLPIYWLHGDETLIIQESQEAILKACRQQGISEREVYTIDNIKQFNWNELDNANASMSLFGDRKLIELRLPGNTLGDAGSKAIQAYASNANPDNVLLITSSKLEKAQFNSKWFKAVQDVGATVQVWEIKTSDLPAWIHSRAAKKQLHLSADVSTLIAERVQGNLLAAAQEIDKLVMAGHTEIDLETADTVVADSARFSVFAMTDAAFLGESSCLSILDHLRAEGNDIVPINSWVTREIRTGLEICEAIDRGQSLDSAMNSLRLWQSKKPIYQAFTNRVKLRKAMRLLQQCKEIDHISKGMAEGNAWVAMSRLLLNLSR